MTKRLRFAIVLLAAVLLSMLPAAAQNTTTVTGTITDPNGLPYSNALVQAQLLPTGVTPQIPPPCNGQSSTNCTVSAYQRGYADVNGNFSMTLASNAVLIPGGTTWQFTVNEAPGVPAPLGTGPQSFTVSLSISGASQNISANLNAAAKILALGAAATSGNPYIGALPSGATAEYRILPGETPAALVDYSGNGNTATGTVGTPPTIISGTGGIACNGTGAVVLPAALNASKTIIVYASWTNTASSSWISPVAGNGAGLTSGGNGIYFTNTQFDASGSNTQFQNFRVVSYGGNNSISSLSKDLAGGTAVYALTMDTSVDHIYINGVEAPMYSGQFQSSAGLQTTGAYQLCGSTTGNNKSPGYLNGTAPVGAVYYAVFYPTMLSAAQVAQASQSIITIFTNRGGGVPPGYGAPEPNNVDQVIFEGDSITAGNGIAIAWTTQLVLSGAVTAVNVLNQGKTGETMQLMLNSEPYATFPAIRQNAARNTVFIWGGTNDNPSFSQATAAAIFANNKQYCAGVRTLNAKCVYISMISRTGQDVGKDWLNPLFRQFWSQTADGLLDIGGTSQFGCDGCNTNSFFQGDNTHPNQYGAYNVVSYLAQRAYNRLWGNRDFSTATTYASAAAAAVATTSGSEAGNVVTVNFAAGSTCLAGTLCTCTGITPAGYNASYLALTGTATQFTGYNSATGLGVITVQGSCSAPQQQDADQYQILNFGAGNYTLQTCEGYTGQNIYIKNINAGSSTIVSFPGSTNYSAELIDGAANLAIAQNVIVGLQSKLISGAAGGCNWTRIQ